MYSYTHSHTYGHAYIKQCLKQIAVSFMPACSCYVYVSDWPDVRAVYLTDFGRNRPKGLSHIPINTRTHLHIQGQHNCRCSILVVRRIDVAILFRCCNCFTLFLSYFILSQLAFGLLDNKTHTPHIIFIHFHLLNYVKIYKLFRISFSYIFRS